MSRERLAFDLSLEKDPERAAHNFASYVIEHADLPIWRRINTEYLFLRPDEKVVDWWGKPIDEQTRKETESDFLENPAVGKIIVFLQNAQHGDVLWWGSPKSIKFGYTESRSIFYEFFKEQGQRFVILHSVPGPHSVEDYFETAKNLSEYRRGWDIPTTEDELRGTPIWVQPPSGTHWARLFERYLRFPPQVWITMEDGLDLQNKEEILKHSIIINKRWSYTRSVVRTRYERIWVGAQMEVEMVERVGFGVQGSGSCGISNTEALRKMGLFDWMYNKGRSWEYHTGTCVMCKKVNVEVGPCEICKECECSFDRAETTSSQLVVINFSQN